MTASIKVQQSRFALLKVEDDEDEMEAKASQKDAKNTQQQSGAKKKNKNSKKKKQNQSEAEELKNLAFGFGSTHSRPQSSVSDHASGHGGKGNKKTKSAVTGKQWDEWKKVDDQFTAEAYEKDLQQAMMQSKLEFEEKKKVEKEMRLSGAITSNGAFGDGRGDSKKKKQKDKPVVMSLDQFNQLEDENKPTSPTFVDDIDDIPSLLPPQPSIPKPDTHPVITEKDHFFQDVDKDVNKILRKEKIQEEYKKQYAAESVMASKYEGELRKKDKEIEFLKATLKKQEDELKQVKKRNKQLCVILAQGEMKDKAEVLMQVTQLSEVRDELTEQVTELTADLEKERSKVHALKAELDKSKGGKHSGK